MIQATCISRKRCRVFSHDYMQTICVCICTLGCVYASPCAIKKKYIVKHIREHVDCRLFMFTIMMNARNFCAVINLLR